MNRVSIRADRWRGIASRYRTNRRYSRVVRRHPPASQASSETVRHRSLASASKSCSRRHESRLLPQKYSGRKQAGLNGDFDLGATDKICSIRLASMERDWPYVKTLLSRKRHLGFLLIFCVFLVDKLDQCV